MRFRRITRFVLSYVLVGLVVAAAVAWLAPDLVEQGRPVVRIDQPTEVDPRLDAAQERPASYADAVSEATPSVVNIYTSTQTTDPRNAFFEDPLFDPLFENPTGEVDPDLETSLGSGVLVSDAGHILTSNHVIEGAQRIRILLSDGRTAMATIVGSDPESDLAVLQIDLPELPHVTLAASNSHRVGDIVLAIGNPFGVGQTVTQGIISALGRSELGLATFENFIQTDAAINPGNSGGALINADGEIIGINTAIFSQSGASTGIGFAIPAALAQEVLTGIIENGRVIRGWIGVQIQPAREVMPGVRVVNVLRGGPADEAGLEAGDLITHLESEPIRGVRALLNDVSERAPGDAVSLRGQREGEAQSWRLEIAERPPNLQQQGPQSPPLR